MPKACFATLQLARFDALRSVPPLGVEGRTGLLYGNVVTDPRAAGVELGSPQAYTFAVLGLHADADSAHHFLDDAHTLVPWQAEAREVWRAVLQPYRHRGEVNWLDRQSPGAVFEPLAPEPGPNTPFVAITSVGWILKDLDLSRVTRFGMGVSGVRVSMTSTDGLHAQHSFFASGAPDGDPEAPAARRCLEWDPLTVSFWRDHASVTAFAYGPGVHKDQMARMREENLSDRTSFSRFQVLRQEGTWHGRDPMAWV